MLYDLDKTFEKFLTQNGNFGSEIDVAFDQPTREWSSRISRPTINMWCFDMRENLRLRQPDLNNAIRNERTGVYTTPPRRMDLTYIVTAWARKIEDEHRLLWRALSTLKRINLIKPDTAEGDLRYSQVDIPIFVADASILQVNLVDLWGVMDNQMRLGFTVTATVELETMFSREEPLVLETAVRFGQRDPQNTTLQEQSGTVKIPRVKNGSDKEESDATST